MKPWEETWTLHHPTIHAGRDVVCEVIHDGDGRGQLAAQAPAMARLLLKLEWIDVDRGDDGCPSCGMFRGSGHAADCEIVEVLRAAGVTS